MALGVGGEQWCLALGTSISSWRRRATAPYAPFGDDDRLSDGPITVGEERRTAYGASGERPWRASDLASGDGEWVGGGEVARRGETNTAHARA